jgi:hypothetical protein
MKDCRARERGKKNISTDTQSSSGLQIISYCMFLLFFLLRSYIYPFVDDDWFHANGIF